MFRISIHAPSRERLQPSAHRSVHPDFNPRSLAGATHDHPQRQKHGMISIHAPSRERLALLFRQLSNLLFQSTLPRGSDIPPHFGAVTSRNFNPRSLAGATFCPFALNSLNADFNPRSLAGATTMGKTNTLLWCISIHAPSRERRTRCPSSYIASVISIHAPSRERPPFRHHIPPETQYFNPRSLAGATCFLLRRHCAFLYFNPRSLAGATSFCLCFVFAY